MKVKVYKSITEVDKKDWDAITGRNRLICTHKYLEAVESARINDCRYYYLVAYEGESIIAHAPVYFISTELDTFARGNIKRMIDLIRRRWKGFLVLRSLECGTPVALGNTISYADGVNRPVVLTRMFYEIERLAKQLHVGVVVFRDFYDQELGLYDYLIGQNYKRVHNLPNTRIEVRWNSFDEYVDAMRSNYKRKIVNQMERARRENISIEVLRDFSDYADELERLWANAYDHAKEYRRERLTSLFFKNMDRCLGDRSAIILMKDGETPIGFSLLLFDDDTLIPLFCGVDYDYNQEYCVYFNILYKVVDVGIREKMKEIDMGITTLAPKKDLGAAVASLNMYMKHFNPLLNKFIPKIFDMMTPQDTIGPRRVFKVDRLEKEKGAVREGRACSVYVSTKAGQNDR